MARASGGLHKTPAPRRSTRRAKASQDEDIPDVYQELLAEAAADDAARPIKKRKTRHDAQASAPVSAPVPSPEKPVAPPEASPPTQSKISTVPRSAPPARSPSPSARDQRNDAQSPARVRQTIVDSDESDDSDMEWEDALAVDSEDDNGDEPEIGDISITFGQSDDEPTKSKRQVRRRAITAVDKKRRLDIHKWHVMCLLYHVHRRNAWCNDRIVQATVRNILPAKALANLVPNPELSQFQASKRFLDGIGDLKMLWSKRFTATAQGMYKPRWADVGAEIRPPSDFSEQDDPMDLEDFRTAASKLEGSQDVGAQLFCALVRGIGLEARLVCSLQPLPFSSAAQPSTPQKPDHQKTTVTLDPYNTQKSSPPKPKSATSSRKPKSRLERALGERHPLLNGGVPPKQRKKYRTAFPVYWVEVFNSIHQKWVTVDPLSTFTVNHPEKLEPPLNSSQNTLTYAIAFEHDYTAKDVTRRYAKAYNAKTRKFRVESTPHGQRWWQSVLNFWRRKNDLDRDQVEDAALARKEAGEGIPKNVQDFKDHPVYVLERHLRHNEVIYPLNQVGKVNVGSSFNPKMEVIYRRKDVHLVRSADKWYRMGRDVRDGEQPLKHAKPKKGRRLSIGPDTEMEDQQDEIGVGLYAEYQTELYIPPPVIRGRVPRNTYGNLDLYVPSMCPPGGTHVRHKLASKAARIVGVDYADAVTGFQFKGRHGTAIVQGVVVAQEYAEAVEAVIEGMEYAVVEAEEQNRKAEALRLWRRFYLGLKIVERIQGREIDLGQETEVNLQDEVDQEDKELREKEFAGGFFPDESNSMEPPIRHLSQHETYAGGLDGGFDLEPDAVGDGGFVPTDDSGPPGLSRQESQNFGSTILSQQQLLPRRQSSYLILEDDDSDAGGFLHPSSPDKAGPSAQNSGEGGGFIQADDPVNLAGGFLPDVHLVEPEVDLPSKPIESQPVVPDVHTEPELRGHDLKETNGNGEISAATPPSSMSDAGSLPLEDPDDEDAEPDWLIDET